MRNKNKIIRYLSLGGALLILPLLIAQEGPPPSEFSDSTRVMKSVFATVGYGFLGIIMSILGFKLFDRLTPFHLETEIVKERNMAVAVVCAAMILGICIIVAMTIFS